MCGLDLKLPSSALYVLIPFTLAILPPKVFAHSLLYVLPLGLPMASSVEHNASRRSKLSSSSSRCLSALPPARLTSL